MTAPRVLPLPEITEVAFTDQVLELARIFGWRTAHFRAAMTKRGWRTPVQGDGKGFPDLLLIRDRVIVAELKVGRNKPTAEQVAWLDGFRKAGAEAYLWTPTDWDDITRILRAKETTAP